MKRTRHFLQSPPCQSQLAARARRCAELFRGSLDWASVFANGKGVQLKAGQKDPFGIAGEAVNKPVIIALQGISFTCAVELMLNADIRIAADNCRFAQLEVQRGFHACGGATLRLPMEIGWGNAQRYLLTGDEWNAAQALQWGRAC